ncbi:MAG: sulfotransferase [Bacteroidales bacterium]|nr:sulfotransferase [Bacteroidales bacterium]
MRAGKEIKSNNYNRQPYWFNAINTVWKASYPLGTQSKLDKDSLIKAARKSTGLHDLGSFFWDEPLERMLTSINEEAKLHPIGQFITRQRLINLLSVRLRAEQYFKKYPEILEQKLYPVMLVIGLQRTGTTKLQRLLASDPENRAVLSWEALNPAPINGDDTTGKERIKIAKTSVKALKYMSPGFFAIHPIEYDAPEEDVLLLDVSFMSQTAEATMHVPSYAAWLEETDQSLAYEYMVKLLKLLQWQRPAKRWVLKTPHHLEFLDLVNEHFGEVQYIWTHRNIYESVPSFLSMVSYSRRLFSNAVVPYQVAKNWVRKNGYMLSKALEFHESNNHISLFTDVPYDHLVKDSMEVIKHIYEDRQESISPELLKVFMEANRSNPQGKYGVHKYELSDFGIDENYIDQYTSAYQQFQRSTLK